MYLVPKVGRARTQWSRRHTPNDLIRSHVLRDNGAGRNLNANVSWGHNFNTRLINNLRYTFSRSRNLSSPFFGQSLSTAGGFGGGNAASGNRRIQASVRLSF